jgi:hypothetical protein
MALSTADILDIIDDKGLPAAVRCIVRVYEAAPKDDPWSAFWSPFAVASVHVARWELGHDKKGQKRFDPKRITDPRFKKLVSGLIPPGGSVEELVLELGRATAESMARLLHMEEVSAEEAEIAEIEDAEQGRREAEEAALRKEMAEILG